MLAFSYLTTDYYSDELLRESVAKLTNYSWVSRIIILQTTCRIPQSSVGQKTELVGADLGYGFDRQPEDGGFDELTARNTQLQLLHLTWLPWLGLIDADELFTEETGELLAQADRASKSKIVFECYHMLQTGRKIWPEQQTVFGGKVINDPHCRIFKNRKEPETFQLAPPQIAGANRTQHCQLAGVQSSQCLVVTGPYHLHFPDRKHVFTRSEPAEAEAGQPEAAE